MEQSDAVCFQMIASIGEATACYMEALETAKNGDFVKAGLLIQQGEQNALSCHREHATLLSAMANHEKIEISLLLMHAEDQMMNGEMIKLMVKELIEVYQTIKA